MDFASDEVDKVKSWNLGDLGMFNQTSARLFMVLSQVVYALPKLSLPCPWPSAPWLCDPSGLMISKGIKGSFQYIPRISNIVLSRASEVFLFTQRIVFEFLFIALSCYLM